MKGFTLPVLMLWLAMRGEYVMVLVLVMLLLLYAFRRK